MEARVVSQWTNKKTFGTQVNSFIRICFKGKYHCLELLKTPRKTLAYNITNECWPRLTSSFSHTYLCGKTVMNAPNLAARALVRWGHMFTAGPRSTHDLLHLIHFWPKNNWKKMKIVTVEKHLVHSTLWFKFLNLTIVWPGFLCYMGQHIQPWL